MSDVMQTETLNFDISEVNKNFKIKVDGYNYSGKKYHTLVGVSGLINLVGVELANKLIDRAFNSADDCCDCKLRRGLRVRFYVH